MNDYSSSPGADNLGQPAPDPRVALLGEIETAAVAAGGASSASQNMAGERDRLPAGRLDLQEMVCIDAASLESDENKDLLRQYFDVRYRTHETPQSGNHGVNAPGLYDNGPEELFDLHPDDPGKNRKTVYLLGLYDGKVVAGRRFIFYKPGIDLSPLELKYPNVKDKKPNQTMVSLLSEGMTSDALSKVTFAEVGGHVVDPDYQGHGFGYQTAQETFNWVRDGKIEADIVVSWSDESNFTNVLRTAKNAGLKELVLEKAAFSIPKRSQEDPGEVYVAPLLFSREPRIREAFQRLEDMGVAKPGDDFATKITELRQTALEERGKSK